MRCLFYVFAWVCLAGISIKGDHMHRMKLSEVDVGERFEWEFFFFFPRNSQFLVDVLRD